MKGLIFTYVITYGGAAAALFNPFYGLLAYVCFAIIKPESLWFWSVEPGNNSRIIAIAMLLGWTAKGFGDWRIGKAKWVILPLVGFWCCGFVGAFFANDQDVAWNFVESLTKIVLPVLVGITTIRTPKQVMQLAWVILLSQGYVAIEMNMAYFSGWKRMELGSHGGLDNNGQAIAMNTAVGLALFMGLRAKELWKKVFCWFLCLMIVHSILFSMSRGGMLAMCITASLAFVMMPKRPYYYAVLIVAMLVGYRLAGKEVTERFLTAFDSTEARDASAESRVLYWTYAWQMMADSPLTGVGPDHYPMVAVERFGHSATEAHSVWLQTGAELGFPGMFFLMSFYGSCILLHWKWRNPKESRNDDWLPSISLMVISSLVGFVVSAQFVSVEALEIPYYVTLLGAAGLKLASVDAHATAPSIPTRPTPIFRPLRSRTTT